VAVFANEYGLKNLILTHFSSRYQTVEELEIEAKSFYDKKLFLANDFDVYGLNKEGSVKKL